MPSASPEQPVIIMNREEIASSTTTAGGGEDGGTGQRFTRLQHMMHMGSCQLKQRISDSGNLISRLLEQLQQDADEVRQMIQIMDHEDVDLE